MPVVAGIPPGEAGILVPFKIPNSGIHPEVGGECGGTTLSTGVAYQTNCNLDWPGPAMATA
eukprot:3800082-Prorocentrum_lima.AAC.1